MDGMEHHIMLNKEDNMEICLARRQQSERKSFCKGALENLKAKLNNIQHERY
jgi:CDGSH-type Zn-finger protein